MPMPAALDRDLRFAIAHKRLIAITYKGRARLVEPHDYGRDKGIVRLLAYQLEPAAARAGWRLLDVPKIEACQVLAQTFPGSRGAAHRQHRTWDELFARVD